MAKTTTMSGDRLFWATRPRSGPRDGSSWPASPVALLPLTVVRVMRCLDVRLVPASGSAAPVAQGATPPSKHRATL
jgi:hypothetical protein